MVLIGQNEVSMVYCELKQLEYNSCSILLCMPIAPFWIDNYCKNKSIIRDLYCQNDYKQEQYRISQIIMSGQCQLREVCQNDLENTDKYRILRTQHYSTVN